MFDNIEKLESTDTDVVKYVFTKPDMVAEAVLYKYPNYETRTVICCSTQCGCPVGCTFCGTGDKFIRNLTTKEIVDQVDHLIAQACIIDDLFSAMDINKLQIMFMSMGEPFLNYNRVKEAIIELNYFYPSAQLLVSTVGIRAEDIFNDFIELSADIENIGLQFSVHESTDINRDKLVPFKHKASLHDIAIMGLRWSVLTGRKPYFNYCVHEDNSSDTDIERLVDLFPVELWECTLSVICEKDETVKSSIDRQLKLINDFSSRMLEAGYNTRIFNPAGQDDIGGGCGQLFHTQKWMQEHDKK